MLTTEGAMKELASLPGPASDSAATENPFCRDAHRGRRGGPSHKFLKQTLLPCFWALTRKSGGGGEGVSKTRHDVQLIPRVV